MYMTCKLRYAYVAWGLEISFKKTESLSIGTTLKIYKSAGTKSRDAKNSNMSELLLIKAQIVKGNEHRIRQRRKAMQQLNNIWWFKGIKNYVNHRIYHTERITLNISET